MSSTESIYGERWFELDRAIGRQMEEENARRQYKEMCDSNDNVHNQTFEEWYEAGNYDPHDWD